MPSLDLSQFDDIQATLSLIRNNCKLITPHYKSIIFTGQTGSGKGTLIHFLIKNQNLYAQMSQFGQMVIRCHENKNQHLNEIKISQKISSETSIPKTIQHKGQVFRDFPGFHDNRQDKSLIVQDIINQFYIAQVYKKTKQVKIIFVTSRSTLNDRGQQFIHSIRNFIKQFDQIDQFLSSTCLVITKVEKQIQIKHVRASIMKILQQMGSDLQKNQKKMLKYFVNTDHLILFHLPQKQGKIDFSESDHITKMIRNLKYCKAPQVKIHFDQHSEIKMKKLLLNWNQYISKICQTYLFVQVNNFFQLFKKFHDVEKNKKNLVNMGTYLDLLANAQDQHVFLKTFTQSPIYFSNRQLHKKIKNQIQKFIKFVTFFYFLGKESFEIQKWKIGIHKLISRLDYFLQEPIAEKHGKTFYLKGFYCDSSIIQKNIDRNHEIGYKPKNFIVFSFLLNLNDDINNEETNLIIMTENINIPKEIEINLKGKNGDDYQDQADINKNGLPGKPGTNGGNLIIRTFHHTIDEHKLCLDLRGGQGGKGQNGGKVIVEPKQKWINKIKEDVTKNIEEKQLLVCRQTYKFSDKKFLSKFGHILRSLGTYNDQILEKYSTQKIKENFFETHGGCHGVDGKCGIVDIGKIDFKLKLKDEKSSLPNFGYKETYEGVYIKEMIFPNLRQAGKQILGCRKKSLPKKQSQLKGSRTRRNSIQFQSQKLITEQQKDSFSNSLIQDLQSQILNTLLQHPDFLKQAKREKTIFSNQHKKNLQEKQVDKINANNLNRQQIINSQIHINNPQIMKTHEKKQISQKNIQFLNVLGLKQLIKQKAKSNAKFIKSKKDKDEFALMISRQLLQEFGKQVATQVGTDVITGVGKQLIQNVGKQTLKTSTKQIGKQFITKGTSTLGAEFIKTEIGKGTVKGLSDTLTSQSLKQLQKAATLQAAKTSLQGGSYIIQTVLGISKSLVLQGLVSAIMASGISDGWLVQPQLISLQVQNGCVSSCKNKQNSNLIQPFKPFKQEQIQELSQDFLLYIKNVKNIFTQIAKEAQYMQN